MSLEIILLTEYPQDKIDTDIAILYNLDRNDWTSNIYAKRRIELSVKKGKQSITFDDYDFVFEKGYVYVEDDRGFTLKEFDIGTNYKILFDEDQDTFEVEPLNI